jgi:hypothetical protein
MKAYSIDKIPPEGCIMFSIEAGTNPVWIDEELQKIIEKIKLKHELFAQNEINECVKKCLS